MEEGLRTKFINITASLEGQRRIDFINLVDELPEELRPDFIYVASNLKEDELIRFLDKIKSLAVFQREEYIKERLNALPDES